MLFEVFTRMCGNCRGLTTPRAGLDYYCSIIFKYIIIENRI